MAALTELSSEMKLGDEGIESNGADGSKGLTERPRLPSLSIIVTMN